MIPAGNVPDRVNAGVGEPTEPTVNVNGTPDTAVAEVGLVKPARCAR